MTDAKPYEIGTIVTGYVTGIKDYGIFVYLDEKRSGLIHISEISKKFVKNVNDFASIEEVIRVKIIGKEDDKHYQLSIKDIDYRIMHSRGSRIQETKSGFRNLAMKLELWMQDKEKQLKNQ